MSKCSTVRRRHGSTELAEVRRLFVWSAGCPSYLLNCSPDQLFTCSNLGSACSRPEPALLPACGPTQDTDFCQLSRVDLESRSGFIRRCFIAATFSRSKSREEQNHHTERFQVEVATQQTRKCYAPPIVCRPRAPEPRIDNPRLSIERKRNGEMILVHGVGLCRVKAEFVRRIELQH